jgi:hypothetical protein
MCGPLVGRSCEGVRCWGGPGVEPRGLHHKFYITKQWGGHVAPMDWATCPHIICHQPDTCQFPIRHLSTNECLPHHPPDTSSYGLYGPATSDRTDCTDRYSQHQIFACLAWRTDRDIFFIRRPFDKVNIPPESGRRDGCNGTVFVAFRAL